MMNLFTYIPIHWKIRLLPEIFFFQEGPGVRKWQFRDKGIKLLNGSNINNGLIDLSNTSMYISEEEANGKYNHFLADVGDLVIASSGITVENFHNKIAFIEKKHLPICMNTSTIRFKSKNVKQSNLQYLRFYLRTHLFKAQLIKLITGSAQLNFGPTHLKQISIPLPTLDDQICIATVLSRAERLIARRKESIGLLDEFMKSTFLEMFGDPVRNEKRWKKIPLSKFGRIITGNTPPRNNENNYVPKYIEWIKTDNIIADKTCITPATEYLSEFGLQKARFVTKGALLVACIAGSMESIGRAALTDRKVSFNQQINAIQPFEDTSSLFLYWLFKNTKVYIQSHATKGMKKILTKGEFEKITMIKPPLPLQEKFASIAEKVEIIKAKYTESLTELENLYGSLSQKAFRGELYLSRVLIEEIHSPEPQEIKREVP